MNRAGSDRRGCRSCGPRRTSHRALAGRSRASGNCRSGTTSSLPAGWSRPFCLMSATTPTTVNGTPLVASRLTFWPIGSSAVEEPCGERLVDQRDRRACPRRPSARTPRPRTIRAPRVSSASSPSIWQKSTSPSPVRRGRSGFAPGSVNALMSLAGRRWQLCDQRRGARRRAARACRSSSRRQNASSAAVGYGLLGSSMPNVSRWSGCEPERRPAGAGGSCAPSRCSRPPARRRARSRRSRARGGRAAAPCAPVIRDEPSLSAPCRSVRRAWRIGARPNTSAAVTEHATANATAWPSRAISVGARRGPRDQRGDAIDRPHRDQDAERRRRARASSSRSRTGGAGDAGWPRARGAPRPRACASPSARAGGWRR